MQYRLVYEDSKGNCVVIVPHRTFQKSGESDASAVERLSHAIWDKCTEFLICSPELIPQDLTFREAWKKGSKTEPITVDWGKALLIHRDRLKEASKRKIEALEKEFPEAIKRQNIPDQVSIRRTQKILETIHEMNLTHCKTIEDIKYSIPRELHDFWPYYDPNKPKPIQS